MAEYPITLTVQEDAILVKVAEIKGILPETLVNNVGTVALKSQVKQYLDELVVAKVGAMNVQEKIVFLTEA